jgi:hypothetical protein
MIGKKKLSTIRAEVREAFVRTGTDPDQWFEQQIRKLERRRSFNQGELETLRLLRDALADAAQAAPKKARRRMASQ